MNQPALILAITVVVLALHSTASVRAADNCHSTCEAIVPKYHPKTSAIIDIYPNITSGQLQEIMYSTTLWSTLFCFHPGAYYFNSTVHFASNIYVYGCPGNVIYSTIGYNNSAGNDHIWLGYQPVANITVDSLNINSTYGDIVLFMASASYDFTTNVNVINNHFSNMVFGAGDYWAEYFLYLAFINDSNVINNTFTNLTEGTGVFISDCNNLLIQNNTMIDVYNGYSIHIDPTAGAGWYITVQNNTSRGLAYSGLGFQGVCYYAVIQFNDFRDWVFVGAWNIGMSMVCDCDYPEQAAVIRYNKLYSGQPLGNGQLGIEASGSWSRWEYNTLVNWTYPFSLSCVYESVFEYNYFIGYNNTRPFTADGYGVNSYCCTYCADSPGEIIGLNYLNGYAVTDWQAPDPNSCKGYYPSNCTAVTTTPKTDSSGLSISALAGIIIGLAVFLCIVFYLLFLYMRRKRRRSSSPQLWKGSLFTSSASKLSASQSPPQSPLSPSVSTFPYNSTQIPNSPTNYVSDGRIGLSTPSYAQDDRRTNYNHHHRSVSDGSLEAMQMVSFESPAPTGVQVPKLPALPALPSLPALPQPVNHDHAKNVPPLPSDAPPLPSSAPPLPSSASPLPSGAPSLPSHAPRLPGSAPALPHRPPPLIVRPTPSHVEHVQIHEQHVWAEAIDNESNQVYYYHKVTKEVTWDRPAEFL